MTSSRSKFSRHTVSYPGETCRICGCEDTRANKLIEQFFPSVRGSKDRQFICFRCRDGISEGVPITNLHNARNNIKEPESSFVVNEGNEETDVLITHNNYNFSLSKKFICKTCKKVFVTKQACLKHLPIHTRERLQCKVCLRSFLHQTRWANHMALHFGNKYRCTKCNIVYANEAQFVQHELTHESKKKYVSEKPKEPECKNEPTPEDYKKSQTEEKPFVCGTCSKAFKSKRNLKLHMAVHRAVKKFKCELCHEKFKNYRTLLNHECSGIAGGQK